MKNWLSWSERRTISPEVVGSILAKTQKAENSNLHGFEVDSQARVLNYCFNT